jgi:S1-C subfamily serine protease/tetratricopeptide (TPR) repeat protein
LIDPLKEHTMQRHLTSPKDVFMPFRQSARVTVFCLGILSMGPFLLAAEKEARSHFKSGETLLKKNQPIEAYQELQSAARLDPSNKKYRVKLAEAGKAASARAEETARDKLLGNVAQAKTWFEAALTYDPENPNAIKGLTAIKVRMEFAKAAAERAHNALTDGDVSRAQTLLAGMEPMRELVFEIQDVEKEIQGVQLITETKGNWRTLSRETILGRILEAQKLAPGNPYVCAKSESIKHEMADSILATAPIKIATIPEHLEALRLIDDALSVDPGNPQGSKWRERELEQLASLETARVTQLMERFKIGGGRIAVELLEESEPWLKRRVEFGQQVKQATLAAFPAIRVKVVIDEMRGCSSVLKPEEPERQLRNAIGRVAEIVNDNWNAELRLKQVSCSSTDLPVQSTEPVNSTYVAGYNQLANPEYLQLQMQLASAQQDLNRAEYNNSVNPNFGTGFALGMAQGRVNRLRSALASTQPYISQPIVQQYQYQRFQAYRAFEISGTLDVYIKGASTSVASKPINTLSEDRQSGVSGVLPQDQSGAKNVQPAFLGLETYAARASAEFASKLQFAARESVASYFARRATSKSLPGSERLAATLYVLDVADGTQYEPLKGAIKAGVKNGSLSTDEEISDFRAPLLPLPPGTEANAEDVGQASNTETFNIELAIDAVVSIETDAGHAGSGFFITPACLVITNEHVISGAEVIVLKNAKKRLFSGSVVAKDPERDLALLRTNARTCSSLSLQLSRPAVGADVYAIGDPLGLERTVTKGIVSSLRQTGSGIHYVQIDAALNPGNSGGPLLTRDGKVIGVNTFAFRGAQGLNFAVSSEEIKTAFRTFIR